MRRQRGFAMLELVVAVLIATLLMVWGASTLVNRINDAAAQASAVWMLSIKKATQAYIERHARALASAGNTTALTGKGYADWTAPRISELKADQLLAPGFPEYGARGLTVAIAILRSGSCPGADCRIEGLVHSTQAVKKPSTGYVDEQMIAQWLMAAQGWGGVVTGSRPDRVSGAAFAWPNPPVPGLNLLSVGTIALAVTSEQLSSLDFLRVRDDRDPDFQDTLSVKGDITTQASLNVQRYVSIAAHEYAQTLCTTPGAIASEHIGGLLVCRNGRWRSAGRGGGGGYTFNSRYACEDRYGMSTANPVTGSCTCPADFMAVRISDSGPHGAPDYQTWGYLCVG